MCTCYMNMSLIFFISNQDFDLSFLTRSIELSLWDIKIWLSNPFLLNLNVYWISRNVSKNRVLPVFNDYFSVVISFQTLAECSMKSKLASTTYLLFNENEKQCDLIKENLIHISVTTVGYNRFDGHGKAMLHLYFNQLMVSNLYNKCKRNHRLNLSMSLNCI